MAGCAPGAAAPLVETGRKPTTTRNFPGRRVRAVFDHYGEAGNKVPTDVQPADHNEL